MDATRIIDVAIIGGGLVGASLALGLLKHKHINVRVYESAHNFGDIGAGIAFGPNALRALRLLDPKLELMVNDIETKNAWPEYVKTWFVPYFGQHEDPGQDVERLGATQNDIGSTTFHRAKLLNEIVAHLPQGLAHFNKRLVSYDELQSGRIALRFEDGTSARVDCVLGTDGIHSTVRSLLLGENHRALLPRFSGIVTYRALVPMPKLRDAIGDEKALNSAHYYGKGRMLTVYPIDHGKTANIAATDHVSYKTWDGPWIEPIDFATVESRYAGMDETARQIVQLLDIPNLQVWSLWESPNAPAYCKGNVAILGDAAHASTPFHGQGLAQGLEDALVLDSILGKVTQPSQIANALRAYDAVRRPLSQEHVRTSREAADFYAFELDHIEIRKELNHLVSRRMQRWWDRNLGEEIEQARAVLAHLEERRDAAQSIFS